MAMSKIGAKAGQAATGSVLLSLNPDTFTSGGLLDDADVVVRDAAFLMWDYNGQQAVAVPALGITFRIKGEESDPDESKDHDQYYSCGKAEDFVPAEGGIGLIAVGAKTGLNNNTNAGLVLASFIAAGVPKTRFDSGNIKTALVGVECHVNRVPAPERSNATPRPDGRKPEILVVTKLLALPGEGSGQVRQTASKPGLSKVSGATKANGAPAIAHVTPNAGVATTMSPSDPELDAELAPVLLELIEANGGTLPKKLIGMKVFGRFKGDPRQSAAMKRASSDEFLMGLTEAGFTYDGATLAFAG